MAEMHFYYTHTDYDNIIYKIRKENYKVYKNEGYYTCEEETREEAKTEALEKYIRDNNDYEKMIGIVPLSLHKITNRYFKQYYKVK